LNETFLPPSYKNTGDQEQKQHAYWFQHDAHTHLLFLASSSAPVFLSHRQQDTVFLVDQIASHIITNYTYHYTAALWFARYHLDARRLIRLSLNTAMASKKDDPAAFFASLMQEQTPGTSQRCADPLADIPPDRPRTNALFSAGK